ncbi:MAG TPA: porin [Burkholderiales bacterium]|nr:porin [Burkholderiales bacterium]
MIQLRKPVVLATSLALAALAGMAQAADGGANMQIAQAPTPAAPVAAAPASGSSGSGLTWKGITLFGTIDAGYAHQTHGAPFSMNSAQGLNYVLARNSNQSVSSAAQNGLSQSVIGLRGDIGFAPGYSAVFRLEAGIDPLTLRSPNGPQSLVENNSRPNVGGQISANDSSRAGQVLNGQAFVGVKSDRYGTLTWGRQNGLLADAVSAYDPNGSSYAFSAAGGSGSIQGLGSSQAARLDSSLKYQIQVDKLAVLNKFRFGAQYQKPGRQSNLFTPDGTSGSAWELQLGADIGQFALEYIHAKKNQAIADASLSAAQFATLPKNSLAATVSDNTANALVASYTWPKLLKLYGGYERIRFANPSTLLPVNAIGVGGYTLSALTQTAYTTNRVQDVYWTGLKYSVTPQLDVTAAYYAYKQNSYATGVNTGCSDTRAGNCAGTFNAESLVGIYTFDRHWKAYAGLMWSRAADGLASGFLNTSNLNTMVGGQFTF